MKVSSTKEKPNGAVPFGNGSSNGTLGPGGYGNTKVNANNGPNVSDLHGIKSHTSSNSKTENSTNTEDEKIDRLEGNDNKVGSSESKSTANSNSSSTGNSSSSSSSNSKTTSDKTTSDKTSNGTSSTGKTIGNKTSSNGNSTSKSGNGGSGKGPGSHRFRHDVPAFNPGQPHLYSQQMHQYQSQMLRQQPQYYAPQPYMYNGQMMPYYPVSMGYQDYGYPPMQQYYGNPPFNPNYINMAAANYYAPAVPAIPSRKRYSKDHEYYSETHVYASPPPTENIPIPEHRRDDALRRKTKSPPLSIETATPNTPKSIDPKDPELPTAEAPQPQTQLKEDIPRAQHEVPELEALQPESLPVDTHTELSLDTEEKDANSLPLLFQLTMDEYLADREISGAINRKLLSTKSQRFDEFVQGRQYAIHGAGMQFVVNHNTGDQQYERIHPESAASSKNDEHGQLKSQPLAWSAVLQATGAKPKKRDGEPVPNGGLAAALLGKVAALKPSDVLDTADVPQSLGLLMMLYLYDPAFKQPVFDVAAQKPRGLTNSGNICYMNVILQCLIFCEPFAQLFHLVESKSVASIGANSPTPLIDATLHFLKDYSTIPPSNKSSGGSFNSDGIVVGKPLSPEPFYQKLIENPKFQHLSWGQQEDAEEFLGYVLDGLHEEFVKVEAALSTEQMDALAETFSKRSSGSAPLKAAILKAARLVKSSGTEHIEESEVVNEAESNGWSEVGSGRRVCKKRVVEVEPSPITRLFGGRFRSVLTIPKGKELQSITLDPFRCVLLDISLVDVQKIEDALWKFNEIEKLPYKVEAGKEVIARKQTFIDKLPEVLILHLKRFSYQNEAVDANASNNGLAPELRTYGTIEKVSKNILYGLTLTVPAECLSTALRKENTNDYALSAVIYHHGRNAEGGHYTCDVLRSGRKWLRIDDTAVEAIDADSVLDMSERDKSAYILMYHRRRKD